MNAEQYAGSDPERFERVEKHNRALALTLTAKRKLKEVGLDFGMQFARNRRQRIETITVELRDSLAQDNDRGIDQSYADLQDELYELNREVRQYYSEDEEDDLFGSILRVFTGDFEDDLWDDSDDNTGGSPPIPSPLRPGPRPGTNDSAELPPIEHKPPYH